MTTASYASVAAFNTHLFSSEKRILYCFQGSITLLTWWLDIIIKGFPIKAVKLHTLSFPKLVDWWIQIRRKDAEQVRDLQEITGHYLEPINARTVSRRAEPTPPFTNVGFDAFGPWTVRTRTTRGGAANAKRWRLVFTCFSSRAIHLSVRDHGHQLIYLRFKKIHHASRTRFPPQVRPRNEFRWRKIRTGRRP